MRYLKSTLSLLCLCLIFVSANAQTRKKANKIKYGKFRLTETFEVLKSDPEVRQGTYFASIASYYEKGQYTSGKRTGVWECYQNEKLVQKYDYDSGKFLMGEPSKMLMKITLLDKSGIPVRELSPRNAYLGGDSKMMSIIGRVTNYPMEAQEWNVQGKVLISAILSKDGQISGEKTETNLGRGLEEEALRVFRLMPKDWVPVLENGEPVTVQIQMPISFTIYTN